MPFMPSYNLHLSNFFTLPRKHLCNVKLTSATLFFKRQNLDDRQIRQIKLFYRTLIFK